jgi:trimethylamine:corrinoid methyltransferase-like protein
MILSTWPSRRTLRRLVGAALGLVLVGYAVLSGFARRPLNPAEFWTFAAAVLRATPAHLGGSNPVETLRLGGAAYGSPTGATVFLMAGQAYTIPLPPRTVPARNAHAQTQRFITFATTQDLHAYLHSTLPRAGWRYREQLGSMHALERGDHVLSVRSTFYVGTRVGELGISLRARPLTTAH